MACTRSIPPRRAAFLAVTAILLAFGGTGAQAAEESCPVRYQAALKSISDGAFARLKDAKALVVEGDPTLPGFLLFQPQSTRRTTDEVTALRVAANLARAKGRADWSASADNRWIADQIRSDLREYLTQAPSPYLCDGVEDYVSILRGYRDRLDGSPKRTEALVALQEKSARRAIDTALATLKPAPRPVQADRQAALAGDLRPAIEAGREMQGPQPKAAPVAQGPAIDPDLPPRGPEADRGLADPAGRIAAIDALAEATAAAGLIPPGTAPDMMTTGALVRPVETGTPSETLPSAHPDRPVLERLAALRPAFRVGGIKIAERMARRDVTAAFSEIEILDYLASRPRETVDPMLAAIDETLDAILAAHAEAAKAR